MPLGMAGPCLFYTSGEDLSLMVCQPKQMKGFHPGQQMKEFFASHGGRGGGSALLAQGMVPYLSLLHISPTANPRRWWNQLPMSRERGMVVVPPMAKPTTTEIK